MVCDFIIKYDPEKDSREVLTDKIFYSLFIRRVKHRKPCIIFIGADSGEGKSYAALKLQERLLFAQNIDIKDFLHDVNVYTPIEYPKKLKALLFEQSLRRVNILTIHESRDVVNSKDWNDFLPRAISDINAQSRTVKRMITIVISQFIRDITTDIRYTLNYYCKIYRPLGQPARIYIYKMWKDDHDLEKPKLRKRKVWGYLVYPSGKYRKFCPEYFELRMPPKEICDAFEAKEFAAKAAVIKGKMDKLIKKMELEYGQQNRKVDAMLEFYTRNDESLNIIGKRTPRGLFKLNPEFKKMHELNDEEVKEFQTRLVEKLKTVGMLVPDAPSDDGVVAE